LGEEGEGIGVGIGLGVPDKCEGLRVIWKDS
jgi:hypothetical protein